MNISRKSIFLLILIIFPFIELLSCKRRAISLENIGFEWNYFVSKESGKGITLGSKIYDINGIGSAANVNSKHSTNLDDKVIVPYEINQKKVISLQNYCFARWPMKEIFLPKSIIGKIPEGCFLNCDYLRQVKFPTGIDMVCAYAFTNCNSLEKIVINSNQLRFAKYSITNCPKLLCIDHKTNSNIITKQESIVNVSDKFHFSIKIEKMSKRNSPKLHAVSFTQQDKQFIISGSGNTDQTTISSNAQGKPNYYTEIVVKGTDNANKLILKKNAVHTTIIPTFTSVELISFFGNVGTEYQVFKNQGSIKKIYVGTDSTVDFGAATFFNCSNLCEVIILCNIKMGNWLFGSDQNISLFYCGNVNPPLTTVDQSDSTGNDVLTGTNCTAYVPSGSNVTKFGSSNAVVAVPYSNTVSELKYEVKDGKLLISGAGNIKRSDFDFTNKCKCGGSDKISEIVITGSTGLITAPQQSEREALFAKYDYLKKVTLLDKISIIDRTFMGMSSITNLYLKTSGVIDIGTEVFMGTGISEANIEGNINMGCSIFKNCPSMNVYYCGNKNPNKIILKDVCTGNDPPNPFTSDLSKVYVPYDSIVTSFGSYSAILKTANVVRKSDFTYPVLPRIRCYR